MEAIRENNLILKGDLIPCHLGLIFDLLVHIFEQVPDQVQLLAEAGGLEMDLGRGGDFEFVYMSSCAVGLDEQFGEERAVEDHSTPVLRVEQLLIEEGT